MSDISADAVRQALFSLYLPTELANCELAQSLPEIGALQDVLQRAQALRGKLLDALELVRPSGRTPGASRGASASRAYDCLRLRYVSGLDVEEVARQLAIGARQVYRDLRWGEEQLAQLLHSHYATDGVSALVPAAEAGQAADLDTTIGDPLVQEIKALAARPEPVHLAEIVESAIAIVAALALRQGISIRLVRPRGPVMVTCTPAVLREVLTLSLSAALQNEPRRIAGLAGTLVVELSGEGEWAQICLPVPPPDELTSRVAAERNTAARVKAAIRVAGAQGWGIVLSQGDTSSQLCLRLPLAKRRRVLVVEDNPGACALYERYLSSSEWDPIAVPHPRLAVDLAVARQVEAVLLDLMMADTDGWTVLQALRLSPRTHSLPVIICSVVSDPELGLTLGASACLTKPVSRLDLLKTLREVTTRSQESGARIQKAGRDP